MASPGTNSSSNTTAASDASSPGSFSDDRNVPQWKKELIQRRKSLARTVSNNLVLTPSPPSANAGKTLIIGSPTQPNKDLVTATSPTLKKYASTDTGIASAHISPPHPNPTSSNHSSFSTSSNIVGHSHHNLTTTSLISTTKNESTLLKQQQQPAVLHTSTQTLKLNNSSSFEAETPFHSQSHSNDGGVNISYNKIVGLIKPLSAVNHIASSSILKIDKTNLSNDIVVGDTVVVLNQSAKPTKCGAVDNREKVENLIQNTHTKSEKSGCISNSNNSENSKANKKHIEFAINNKMVAAEEVPLADDASEELTYGPGIVSKLRCRYLSLALRQSKASRQRPSLNNLRRATSLNNLLDGDDEEESGSDEDDDVSEDNHQKTKPWKNDLDGNIDCRRNDRHEYQKNDNFLNVDDEGQGDENNYVVSFQKNRNRTNDKNTDYNRYKQRGNESMKRARSVETLLRYENKGWNKDNNHLADTQDKVSAPDGVGDEKIESRIINAREHGAPKPKRLTSYIDDTERPPPDVVKQTLKIFEATNNRRGRATNRKIGSEVAAKVATFKSIISLEKPLIAHAKPPLSPKKPNIKPRTMTTQTSLPKTYSPNNTTNIQPAVSFDKMNKFNKEKPVLPKLDINIIKNNLESTNNNSNNNKTNYQENNVLLNKKQPQQHQRTPSPVTVRCDFQSYRNNNSNNTTLNDSPLSPQNRSESCSPNTMFMPTSRGPPPPPPTQQNQQQPAQITLGRQERSDSPRKFYASLLNSNFDSPFTNLSEKMNNFNLNDTSTPVKTVKMAPIGPPPLPPPRTVVTAAANNSLMNKLSPTINSLIGNEPKSNKGLKKENNVQQRSVDSSSSDFDDDYDDTDDTKRISRSALDSISKAGNTTEFKFNNTHKNSNNICENKNAKNQMLNEKPYLPNGTRPASAVAGKKETNESANNLKQIVKSSSLYDQPTQPKQLTQANLNALSQQTKSEFNYNFLNQSENVERHSSSSSSSSSTSSFIDNGELLITSAKTGSDTNSSAVSENNLLITRDSLVIGQLNNSIVATATSSNNTTTTSTFLLLNNTNNKDSNNLCSNKPVLTSREIEKNLLNKEKSFVESSSTSSSIVGGISGGDNNGVPANAIVVAAPSPAPATVSATTNNGLNKKKSWQQPQENNTMVFNFSNRTDVPDYIENAGIVIRRKKELPKPGESGFVLLGDLTLETSTDDPEEDAWTLGPPSPCNVEFPDGGIIINGKSSLRSKPKEAKLKIQFDDSLTSTFEYPSESSLLEDVSVDDTATDQNRSLYGDGILSTTKLLTSMPLGTNPFASYTPVKASIATHFELGVTRVPSPPTNGHNTNNSSSSSSNNSSISNYQINGSSTTPQSFATINSSSSAMTAAVAAASIVTTTSGNEETDSLQYLKPATDEQTVQWSEGTRATDLLF